MGDKDCLQFYVRLIDDSLLNHSQNSLIGVVSQFPGKEVGVESRLQRRGVIEWFRTPQG